jgi:hypothetical protein
VNELLMQTSVPFWLVDDGGSKPSIMDGWDADLYPQVDPTEFQNTPRPLFRGVAPDRFFAVMTTGVDVDPTDAPIYCSDFDKAWEYGGTSMSKGLRLVYALDSTKLERTFRTLRLDAAPSEIDEVRQTYPHQHVEHEGSLWFSRIDRYFPGYEIPYAYWVPGNAKDALTVVFLLGGEQWRKFTEALIETSTRDNVGS